MRSASQLALTPIHVLEDFSAELRQRTTKHHTASTSLVNLAAPLALSSPTVYRAILSSFYWIYKTLEEELETRRRQYPKVSPIYFPQLLRTAAFETDLLHYYGPEYHKHIATPSPATAQYITFMQQSIERDPVVLIAQCQTMYMALFGGGVFVKKWIRNAFKYPDGVGTAIFDFSHTIDDVSLFQQQYYDAINRISLSRMDKNAIIEHKKRVFQYNDTIFEELRESTVYTQRVRDVLIRFFVLMLLFLVAIYTLGGATVINKWILGS